MKRLLLGALFITQAVMAELPTFEAKEPLLHGGGEKWISDGKYPNPTHADWDQDGDRDMLVGYMFTEAGTAGHIVYYENTGSDEAPVFTYKEKFPITVGGA